MDLAQTAAPSRWAKAVRFIGPIMLVLGVIVLVSRLTGNHGEAPTPPQLATDTPTADQSALTPAARKVAEKFVLTAVAGKKIGDSWALLDPTYPGKSDFSSRADWVAASKGEGLPLVPAGYAFERKDVSMRVKGVYPGSMDLTVVIIPTDKTNFRARSFDLSLKRHGSGDNPRWLVDYWMTDYDAPVRGEPK